MAYNEEKLARLKHLKQLAQKAKAESDAVVARVKALEDVGAQANVLETIKVNGVVQSIEDKAVDIEVPGYTVEKSEKSGDYAAVYQLMKDGVAVGAAINIPKDMVVKSGSVVTNPTGQPKGTYIKLVLANATNDTLYVDVGGLIEYVTSGSAAGDMVVIAIDEQTHKVTASITDGAITKAKLETEVQTALNKAHEHANKALLDTYDQTNADIRMPSARSTLTPMRPSWTRSLPAIRKSGTLPPPRLKVLLRALPRSRPAPPKAILRSMAWRPRSLPSPPTLRSLRC